MRHPVPRHAHRPAVSSLDVQVLQTAAALENLAVACYESVARLRAVQDGSPLLREFVARTRAQHAAHAQAFNAAAVRAGGRAQHAPDHRYATTVKQALDSLASADGGGGGAASAVSLLESLEDTKVQSYARFASLTSPALRPLLVSVASVEAEHRAFLLAAVLLLNAGAGELLRLPTDAAGLPSAIGSGCFSKPFYPTVAASAVDEGAVR